MRAPMRSHLVLDFDSTIVTVESLDELAACALAGRPDGAAVLARIRAITDAGMDGSLPIDQSLMQRLALLQIRRPMLDGLIERLIGALSPSLVPYRDELHAHAARVWVISSGFHEWIDPVVGALGIAPGHVLANRLAWTADGACTGLDPSSQLATPKSKPRAVRALALDGRVIAVGDGMTDWEIRAEGAADTFLAFTETIARPPVIALADRVVSDFGAVMSVWRESDEGAR